MHVRRRAPSPGPRRRSRRVAAVAAPAADRTVLSIGAHAGDAEITTGALLARHQRLGDRVVMLHLTLGEGGNPKLSPAAYGEQKKREALAAAKALGAEVLFGPWKDGELRDTEEAARTEFLPWTAEKGQEMKKPGISPAFLQGWLKGFEPSTLRATI